MQQPVKVPEANSYVATISGRPSYKYRVVTSDVVAVPSRTSTTQSVFTLPSNVVYNLGQSRLRFQISEGKQGANNSSLFHGGSFPARTVRLTTERGVSLVDCSNVMLVSKVLNPLCCSKEEWATKDDLNSNAADMLPRSNALNDANEARFIAHDGALVASQNFAYHCPQSHALSADNGDLYLTFDVPLGQIVPHSVLALDKDLHWGGEALRLEITWAPGDETSGLMVTANVQAANNAAPLAVAATSYTFPVAPMLHLAIQDNQSISQSVMNQVVSSGIHMSVQYLNETYETTTAALQYSRQIKLNMARGGRLLRSVYGFHLNTGQKIRFNLCNRLSYDSTTGATTYQRISDIRTWVNALAQQDRALNPMEWFRYNYKLYSDTIYPHAQAWLESNSAFVEDYSGLRAAELSKVHSVDGGMSLANPIDLQIDVTKNGDALNFFHFAVLSRVLHITQSGVDVTMV